MADFFVDVATGDDAADNPGTAATRPLATVTRATELAALATEDRGTIFVAAGTYEAPNERFPILVRPGYVLQGAGKAATVVRVTGESRLLAGGSGTYWGGTGIVVGRALRDLTVRADPPPESFACRGMLGVDVTHDEAVVEDVDILAPELPGDRPVWAPMGDEWGWDPLETGFGTSIILRASATYRSSRVSHSTTVRVHQGPDSLVENVTLEWSRMYVSDDATVRGCRFRFAQVSSGTTLAAPILAVVGGSPTIEGNVLTMGGIPALDCSGGATPRIVDNDIAIYYGVALGVRDGAAPTVVNNRISAKFGLAVVELEADAGPAMFEGNTFYDLGSDILVAAPADFGGGASGSRGNNHFGPIVHGRFVGDIPTGGEVHAEGNFWRDGRPETQVQEGATTRVRTDRAGADFLGGPEAELVFLAVRRRA